MQYLSKSVCDVVVDGLVIAPMAVAALEGLHHGGNGERQEEEPNEQRNQW